MADGRKNEEIKVIKNPLLRQNLLLEEISGISFVVPTVCEKLEAVNNGSSQGLEVSPVGAKREGSDDKHQETQSFTDIPLDVPEPSEEIKPPPFSSDAEKQEGTSFGFRSIIPSFVPLLVPQSLKTTLPKESKDISTPIESEVSKRVSTPETVVPQLLPPTSSENSSSITAPLNFTKKEVFPPVPSPTSSASSAASYAGTPPLVTGPPPVASSINKNANINPYALKRTQYSTLASNFAGSKSQTNESPYFVTPLLSSPGSTFHPQEKNLYMIPSFPTSNSNQYTSTNSNSTIGYALPSSAPKTPTPSNISNASSIPSNFTCPAVASVSNPALTNISSASSIPSLTNIPPTPSIPSFTNMPPVSSIHSLGSTLASISSLSNMPPSVSPLKSTLAISSNSNVIQVPSVPSLINAPPGPSIPLHKNTTLPSSITSFSNVSPAPSVPNSLPAPSMPNLPPAPTIQNLPPASSIPNLPLAPSMPNLPTTPSISNLPTAPSISNLPPAPSIPNFPSAPSISNLPTAPSIPNLPTTPSISNLQTAPSIPNSLPAPYMPNSPPVPTIQNLPPASSIPNLPPASSIPNLPPAPSIPNFPPAPSIPNLPSTPYMPSLPAAPPLPNLPPVPSIPSLSNPSSSVIAAATIPHSPSIPSVTAVTSMVSFSPTTSLSSLSTISKSFAPLINSSNPSSTEAVQIQSGKDSLSNTSSETHSELATLPVAMNPAHTDSASSTHFTNDSKAKEVSEASQRQNSNMFPVSLPSDTNNLGPMFSNNPQVVPQSGPITNSVTMPVTNVSAAPNSIIPPPMSSINKSGSTNPYTLQKSYYSSPYVSKERTVSPSLNTTTTPFFNQSSPYSSSSFNMLSGPGINSCDSAAPNFQESQETNKFDNSLNSKNENVQFPLVKNFASAISNFISPNKQPNELIENKSFVTSPDSDGLSVINNNYQQSSLPYSIGNSGSLQTQADRNISLPSSISGFNINNNNGVISSGPSTIITDNTVCVSSITTALSSVAPSSGIPTTPHPQIDVSLSSIHLAPQVSQTPDNNQSHTFSNVYNLQNQQPTSFNNSFFNNNITDNQVQNIMLNQSNENIASTPTSVSLLENNSNLNIKSDKMLSGQEATSSDDKIACKIEPVKQKEEEQDLISEETSKNFFPGAVPVIQPIPTFNYFSNPQSTSIPPPDKANSFQTKQVSELPTSSFFKPIECPNVSAGAFPSHTHSSQGYQNVSYTNTLPVAPSKISFPPPNVTIPQKTATKTPPKSEPEKSESFDKLDFEELDQIPLEGSAVPLYRPDYLSQKKKAELPASSEVGNSYRLSGGLKKPTYAPVPDLGLTGRKSYPEPSRSNSLSSQEEMAAIEAQSSRISPQHGKTSPSTSTTLDTYYSNLLAAPSYRPPHQHWFFKSGQHKKSPWTPFSMADSLNLEQTYTSLELNEDTKVHTDGGRYDVDIINRKRTSVYWVEPPGEVRRCSWFVKSVTDSRYTPYDENIAALLEDEYKKGCETNEWNRRIELADGEVIILHSPTAMAHHVRSTSPDAWGSQPTLQQKPRVVKRGIDDFNIPKGESKQVDHLLLMVHGVGKACDLRFRSLVEVVDDFRNIAQQLVSSHFHSGVENGNVGRVEILPVEWHGALHTEAINDRLSAITLTSIPRAREFTNETLLDILFYTSPVFAETIVQAVGGELNRVYTLYKERNPGFRGQVSLGGHSLGSLILFDILCHQKVQKTHFSTQSSICSEEEDEAMDELGCLQKTKAKLNRRMSYLTIGPGTGQPYTSYPQLLFQPRNFFALGSPIGMFVTVRGLEALGEDFKFPTCPSFFNIFHPNDPVAYRIEALLKPEMATVPAVLIPHHKGRKRMHLELKETMAHVTAALKQKLVDSMKNTWNAVYHLTLFNRKDNSLQGEVNQVIEDEVMRDLDSDPPLSVVGEEGAGTDVKVGKLNGGRRVDYVLQEAPLETFNQYISAIRSHLVYWESEDTTLMILKEIYGGMGINPDTQVPQAILPFDLTGEPDSYSDYTYSIGALPTQFVRK